ncbi:MAG: lytic polysaccharide monooxygenase [Hamadaea sp.]|nr:lytic polysaccharide monooxygenase [Hamadaea sp.]
MTRELRHRLIAAAAVVVASAAPVLLLGGPAVAHGTMQMPLSRVYTCYQDNPESPRLPVCQAVVAAGGTQPLYDWREVNIADAAGRHREIIPDGRLCSAGRDKYRGLDLAREDWPATTLTSGKSYTFRFQGTAPHRGTFELYLTRDGYSPAKPLTWADLRSSPFARVTDPTLADGVYQIPGTLPTGSGRAVVYAIWQRSDSPEAFYSCSDVLLTGSGGGTVPGASPAVSPAAPDGPKPSASVAPKPSRSASASPSASAVCPAPSRPRRSWWSLASSETPAAGEWRTGPIVAGALLGMFLGGALLTGVRRVYAGAHRRRSRHQS